MPRNRSEVALALVAVVGLLCSVSDARAAVGMQQESRHVLARQEASRTADSIPRSRLAINSLNGSTDSHPDLTVTANSRAVRTRAATGPVFSVGAFGANGADTADDAPAIQLALDAANGTGGIVYFPAGVYYILSALYYGTNVSLAGDGVDATTIRNTRSRTDVASTPMLLPDPNGVIKQNVVVRDMTWDQDGDYYDAQLGTAARWGPLMNVAGTDNMTVQRVGFRDVRTTAISSENVVSYEHVSHLNVLDNRVSRANGGGFSFFGNFTDAVIDGNIIDDTADEAIAVQNTQYDYPRRVTISNNTVRNCVRRAHLGPGEDATPNGIDSFGADDVTIRGNTITGVFASGLSIGVGALGRSSTTITVTGNFVSGAGTNNNPAASGVPAYGAFFAGTQTVSGKGNTFSGNPYGDIGVYGANMDVIGFPPTFP
jgi:polygalacturonase